MNRRTGERGLHILATQRSEKKNLYVVTFNTRKIDRRRCALGTCDRRPSQVSSAASLSAAIGTVLAETDLPLRLLWSVKPDANVPAFDVPQNVLIRDDSKIHDTLASSTILSQEAFLQRSYSRDSPSSSAYTDPRLQTRRDATASVDAAFLSGTG